MIFNKIFNISFAFILLLFAIPILIIAGIILAIELKSWPVFEQERGLTLDKYLIKIYKLKTIKPQRVKISHTTEEDIFLKPGLRGNVTPFAQWLRKTGLDELPQLLNVIMGQMNLIGPRPLMLEDLETIKKVSPELYSIRGKFRCKPGISGIWQLFGNRAEGLIGMIALESLYERTRTFFFDLKLILYTTSVVIQAKNSDSIFYIEKQDQNRVKTIFDNSSNLKVTLNMPEGISKFIIEKVVKSEGKYTVEIPQDWWYVSDSYESAKKETSDLKILKMDKDSKKNAS
jgi:lipopolysaccharide/colanic/teichoic acid biosynthesis glycosyltransferase